jgi:hypothetical protein
VVVVMELVVFVLQVDVETVGLVTVEFVCVEPDVVPQEAVVVEFVFRGRFMLKLEVTGITVLNAVPVANTGLLELVIPPTPTPTATITMITITTMPMRSIEIPAVFRFNRAKDIAIQILD